MRKNGLLHAKLAEIITAAGHGDLIVIGDAGLPVPTHTPVIDLAVVPGLPAFLPVLKVILAELATEAALIASETAQYNPVISTGITTLLGDLPQETITHTALKALCQQAKVVVRTGECTPYANIILRAGVTF
ncbi:D-ribose pyranase [Leeia oryzae]|uniref:D-ribose pyranase n=1 Tax=Leeia oryzae TaxID=356662 RepID=UPI00038273EA|nr:D-ribose pyranase [Leeia oryzae]